MFLQFDNKVVKFVDARGLKSRLIVPNQYPRYIAKSYTAGVCSENYVNVPH